MRFAYWKNVPILLLAFVSILAFIAAAPPSVEAGKVKTFYADTDSDGYGDPNNTVTGSKPPPGYVRNSDDCDDSDPDVNPAVPEVCGDNIDQNCDGTVDEGCGGCTDNDFDTFAVEGGSCGAVDCDDSDDAVYPGATEVCDDGIDQNCDGTADDGCGPSTGRWLEFLDPFPTEVLQNATWPTVRVGVFKNGALDTRDNKTEVSPTIAPGATGILSGAWAQTAINGIAYFTVFSYDTAETMALRARASNSKIAETISNPVAVLPPRQLEFFVQPASIQVRGEIWTPAITVRLLRDGTVDANDNTTQITLSPSHAATGTLSGTVTQTVVNGTATFADLTYDVAEMLYLRATGSSVGISAANSSWVTVHPPRHLEFGIQPASPQQNGEVWTPPFTVQVMADGAVYSSDNTTWITLSVSSGGGGALAGTVTRYVSNGVATFNDIAYNGTGTTTLLATPSDPLIADVSSNPVTVDPLYSLEVSAQPASPQVRGEIWTPPVSVRIMADGVVDASNNTTQITLSATAGATGALSGALTQTVANGVASFADLAYDVAETLTVDATASLSAITPVTTNPVTVHPPRHLEFSPQPTSPQSLGSSWTPPFSVRVVADGAVYTSDNTTQITLSPSPGASGSLVGIVTRTVVNGVATFNSVGYTNDVAETITLEAGASDPAITPAVSNPVVLAEQFTIAFSYSYPRDGKTDVPIRPVCSVTFNQAVDPATVGPGTYFLSGPGGIVPGSYVFSNGNTVVDYDLTGPLSTSTSYTLTVTGDITNTLGLPLANPLSNTFTTEDQGWGWPVTVNHGFSYNDVNAVVRVDAAYSMSGAAMVVYENSGANINIRLFDEIYFSPQHSLERYNYWESDYHHLSTGTVWDHFPDAAMDDAGNAIVTYVHWVSTLEVRAVTYDVMAETWSPPSLLGSVGSTTDYPVLAMAGSGQAVAAWSQPVGGDFQVTVSRFLPGSGWQTPEALSSAFSVVPTEPVQAAVNDDGRIAVVWNQPEIGFKNVYASLYDPATGQWTAPVWLGQHSTSVGPQVGIDTAGRALFVFAGLDGSLYSMRYDGAEWDNAYNVSGGLGIDPNLAVSPDGNATLAYLADFGIWQTLTRHYTNGSWEMTSQGLGPIGMASDNPRVVRDDSGNATVIYESGGTVYVSRYEPGTGWLNAFGLALNTGTEPVITVNPYGNIMAAFRSGMDGRAWRYASGQ